MMVTLLTMMSLTKLLQLPMKQLEEWVPEEDTEGGGGLEEGVGGGGGMGGGAGSNGWSAHEMFAKNAEFGVETSYDPKLVGYTTELKVGGWATGSGLDDGGTDI